MQVEARVDRLEESLARFMERTDQIMMDIRANAARTDAMLIEMQRRADEERRKADEHRLEFDRRAEEERKEFSRRAEADRRKAEQERRDFNKRLAEMSDSMGTLVEDMVAPNAEQIASQIFGPDPVVTIARNVQRRHPEDIGRFMEIDLLVVGREHVMVVEAKRKITPERIRAFLNQYRKMPAFFPEYAHHRLVPVIASVSIAPNVIQFLNREKVYGVAMGDRTMELVNLGQFE